MKKTLYIITFFIIWIICTSCTKKVYVPITSTLTDIQYKDRIHYDSVHILDSIYIKEKGDTITIYRYRDRWKDRYIHDTTYICKIDTIREPYPIEKQLTRLQRIQMNFGMAAFIAIISIVIGWLVKRKFL